MQQKTKGDELGDFGMLNKHSAHWTYSKKDERIIIFIKGSCRVLAIRCDIGKLINECMRCRKRKMTVKIIFVNVDKVTTRIDSIVFTKMKNILSQIYNWFGQISEIRLKKDVLEKNQKIAFI